MPRRYAELLVYTKRALAVGLVSWVGACGEEASSNADDGADAEEPICGWYVDNGGAQLVDPPRTCLGSYCDDGVIYQVLCDGLGCTCLIDGWPQESLPNGVVRTPRCPRAREAASLCGWPASFGETAADLVGAIQGLPCEDAVDAGDCECVDGAMMCPGAGGCNVVGDFAAGDAEIAIHFRADGTFYVADSADTTYQAVSEGSASGFHGTWALTDARLSVRSLHPGSDWDVDCSREAGRYAVTFAENCRIESLKAIDEPCLARAALNTSLAPL